jgi:hypothetical protein
MHGLARSGFVTARVTIADVVEHHRKVMVERAHALRELGDAVLKVLGET